MWTYRKLPLQPGVRRSGSKENGISLANILLGRVSAEWAPPCPATEWMPRVIGSISRFLCALGLLLPLPGAATFAEETNPPSPTVSGSLEATNTQEPLRVLAEFQEQLKANQMVIEQNGKEAREAAARNSDLLSRGLQSIETAFADQGKSLSERNDREIQAVQSSTRTLVIVGGAFAAVATLALLMVTYLQYRMSKVWAGISTVLPTGWSIGEGSSARELVQAESQPSGTGPVNEASLRLIRALERLETRVQHLERPVTAPSFPSEETSEDGNGDPPVIRIRHRIIGSSGTFREDDKIRIAALLEQGQSLFKQSDWDGALRCFNEVLSLDPIHGEALVKKGAALEHLKQLNEAFECYDQAIAADDTMTIAYLHKGGLCSRLERFQEALECYEKALKTHDEF